MFLPSHLHNGSGSDQKYWLRPAPAPQHCSDTSPGHEFKHIFEYFSKTRPKILYFILQHLQKNIRFFLPLVILVIFTTDFVKTCRDCL